MALTEEAKKTRSAYYKKWASENKDKLKAAQERYWNKKAQEMQQAQEA